MEVLYEKCHLFVLLGFLFLAGCGALESDKVAVPLGASCELADSDDLLEISAQFSVPAGISEGGGAKKGSVTVLTSTGRTFAEASFKLAHVLPLTPLFTHVQTFIIGEKLAQSDVGLIADFMARNPNARETVILFISRGNPPDKIYNTETPLEYSSGSGLAKMIQIQERQTGIYQPVNFGDFITKLTTCGIEPVCPQVAIIKTGDKDILQLQGTAVFKENRMVGELNEAESQAFRWLNPKGAQGGLLTVKWDDNSFITMEIIRMEPKFTAVIDKKGKLKMRVELKSEGNFYEQTSNEQILTARGVKKVNTLTSRQIEKNIDQCIKKVQLMGSDVFGWGLIYKRDYPDAWEKMQPDWPHYFAQIEPEIKVSFETRRTYLTDKSFTFKN